MKGFNVYAFEGNRKWHYLRFHVSKDGQSWEQLEPKVEVYLSSENNYAYSVPKLYSNTDDLAEFRYLKIQFYFKVHLSRTEIIY